MLVRHLLCGLIAGLIAGLVSALSGFSLWAAVGFYVLGANLGLLVSAAAGLVRWPHAAARELRQTAADPAGLSPAE